MEKLVRLLLINPLVFQRIRTRSPSSFLFCKQGNSQFSNFPMEPLFHPLSTACWTCQLLHFLFHMQIPNFTNIKIRKIRTFKSHSCMYWNLTEYLAFCKVRCVGTNTIMAQEEKLFLLFPKNNLSFVSLILQLPPPTCHTPPSIPSLILDESLVLYCLFSSYIINASFFAGWFISA